VGSTYLQPSEYAAFGVPNATAAQVNSASTLIDSYLLRSQGAIYVPDASGAPGWMAGANPRQTYHNVGGISPGKAIAVQLSETPALLKLLQVGDVLILDRENEDAAEACVITGIPQPGGGNTFTLREVLFAHDANIKLESGMVILEERAMPNGRPKTGIAHWPIARLFSGEGRYGFGRRSSGNSFALQDFNVLSAMQQFGGPPIWEPLNPDFVGWEPEGDIWVPSGILLAYFTRIRLRFVAGWTAAELPFAIKQACATLVASMGAAIIPPNFKSYKTGDTEIVRFAASQMDEDTKRNLLPYQTRAFV
jgi:hypothetical protein